MRANLPINRLRPESTRAAPADDHLSRRRFLTAASGAGLVLLGGCQVRGANAPVSIVAYNKSSNVQRLSVRVFDPDNGLIETYSYALPPRLLS
jgi:hypothetical protein